MVCLKDLKSDKLVEMSRHNACIELQNRINDVKKKDDNEGSNESQEEKLKVDDVNLQKNQ